MTGSAIDPLLDKPGAVLRLGTALANVLAATPEFRAVHMEPGQRELRALIVAGELIGTAEGWLTTARIVDEVAKGAGFDV